jgi:hypothetical protein
MAKEVNDIDELEAMLAGLDNDDLAALEELDAPVAAAPASAKPVRKRNLKPLKDFDEPVATQAPAVQAVVTEDDLAGLEDLDSAPVVAPATSKAAMNAAELEAFAVEVIDLIGSLAIKFAMTEELVTNVVAPVIAQIDDTSDIDSVHQQMLGLLVRKQEHDKLADKPFEPDEAKPRTVEDVTDAELAELVETVETAERVINSGSAKSDEDELAALLATVEVEPAPAPVVSAPSKPVAVTPVGAAGRKAGALNTFIDADQLQRDLHFTEATINDGMTRQAALFAHYARLSADATYQSDRAKQQVDLLEAQLNQKFRDAMIASGTKFTEKSIDALVIQDSSYQAAQERAHEAKAIASMVASAADSFRHRKDMLIQVGADLRLEKQGELRMKEHAGERALSQLESK